ncbi:(Na+)-NQR maturation NqrM [Marinobacter sp. BGYM27]|uniref:(Na+)-NQR maturation NqrM n=1 Tax=unclassified Marinobacter TaxID=83889 RepID=UPI0021A86D2E|nr:(Na+)-NQR maturation NqrM [Marinobacter sp. BGYM27]MDG5498757.1 (Na+)-NQR maturation NqrM [Marinobacter sp. BGYM27]
MGTFLLVFLIVGILLAGMSIGVLMGRKPISGTCGGIGALGMVGACDICGGDDKKCEEENERVAALAAKTENAESLAYNADKDAS